MPCVICGPSGVGKGTLLNKVKEILPSTFGVAVSHTTRKPRPGDVDGIHYHFTTKEDFERGIANNEFIEYADVHGYYYGTSVAAINNVSKSNLICLLEIDFQGAQAILAHPQLDAHQLFITCPGGVETLRERLQGRHTETAAQIDRRLKTATSELEFLEQNPDFFERVIVNDDLMTAVHQLTAQFKAWYPWIATDNISTLAKQQKKQQSNTNTNINTNNSETNNSGDNDNKGKGDDDDYENLKKATKFMQFIFNRK